MNFLAQKRSKIFLQNDIQPLAPAEKDLVNFHYKEIAKLSGSGGWSVNFVKKKSYLDSEARRILETPPNFHPSLRTALEFYAEEHREKVAAVFMECSEGNPFSTVIKMRTYTGKEFWARVVGKPVINETREVIGIQGVFQDITDDKLKELELIRSLKVIETQNAKLNNFANIITHSLRSHASNLKMTLELYKESTNVSEKEELCEGLSEISANINATIEHLTELGSIHRNVTQEKRSKVNIDTVLSRVKSTLRMAIADASAEIYTDFSEVPEIDYIESYLESILLNLVSNALKYRSPERNPVIEIYSYKEDDRDHLMVKDNGQGIDLEKHGQRMFNIYQTFHANKDAEGVGLFLIKNKIESLQGSISVESEVGRGTTFTIML
jgi:signal transduction histidine kinase